MNTQNLSTLQVFQSFCHKGKSLFIQLGPKEFVGFLCKCIINLLKLKLQSIKRHPVEIFQSVVRIFFQKRKTWKQRRYILASDKGIEPNKVISPLSLAICPGLEQFVLVAASVYNKCLITQSVTKQELPKYQPSRKPTYPIDSLKKEMNKNLFSEAKQNFVLSTYQALILTNFNFG